MAYEAMKEFHTRRRISRTARGSPTPTLRVVASSAPTRPRWRLLYGMLLLVLLAGLIAHARVPESVTRAVDGVFGLAMFAVLAGWMHVNRLALSRVDEPAAGPGRAPVRIVRSRVSPEAPLGAPAADDPDARVLLPYDFR